MQDFRCHHLYRFLPQRRSWPAPLVGAGTGHEGVGRGESSRSGWCSHRIAPCNSVLFVPSGGRRSRVARGQRSGTRRDLLAYSFIILPFFPLSPLPNPVVVPVDVFAPLHSCRSLSSPLASASGQRPPPTPPTDADSPIGPHTRQPAVVLKECACARECDHPDLSQGPFRGCIQFRAFRLSPTFPLTSRSRQTRLFSQPPEGAAMTAVERRTDQTTPLCGWLQSWKQAKLEST